VGAGESLAAKFAALFPHLDKRQRRWKMSAEARGRAMAGSSWWRDRPLTSHEVIVQTIAATTTRTGLTVQAELDTSDYHKASRSQTGRSGTWRSDGTAPPRLPPGVELLHRPRHCL